MKRLAPLFLAVFVLVGTSTAFSVQAADEVSFPLMSNGLPPLPLMMPQGSSNVSFDTWGWLNETWSQYSYIFIPKNIINGQILYNAFRINSDTNTINLNYSTTGFKFLGASAPAVATTPGVLKLVYNGRNLNVTSLPLPGYTCYFYTGEGKTLTINGEDPFTPAAPSTFSEWWDKYDKPIDEVGWRELFEVGFPELWNIIFPKEETDKEPTYTVTTPTPEPVEIYNPDGDLVFTIPLLPGGDCGGGFSLPDITINFPATEDDPAYELPLDIDQQVKLTVGSAQTLARENETQGALTSLVGGFPLEFVKFIGVASAIVLICGIVHRNLG